MELTSNELPSPRKRVSFQDNTKLTFLRPDSGNVEISELFPNMHPALKKSILRTPSTARSHSPQTARSFSPRSTVTSRLSVSTSRSLPKKMTSHLEDDNKSKKRRKPLLPYKEPTESLAHALLRSMTHRQPTTKGKKRVLLPKIALLTNTDSKLEPEGRGSVQSRLSNPSRGGMLPALSRSESALSRRADKTPSTLPEIVSTPRDTGVVYMDRTCGLCKRASTDRKVRKAAAGFCKYCDDYLCAECVINHRGKLTKLHPVIVFYCETCKEMNILNRRGAGYCIRCKFFYCSVDVVSHCQQYKHEVLEGRDLLDVTDVLIGK